MESYYDILAVQRGASAEEIKKSYRRLSKQYHPDMNQNNKTAERRFTVINAAYNVLRNPILRKDYDEKLCLYTESGNRVKEQFRQQQHNSSPEGFKPNKACRTFEQFYGYDPKSNKTDIHYAGKSQRKNPSVTSYIFEGFINPKKK